MQKNEDWEILVAGQRVQTIKKDDFEGGSLEFGTQLVSSKDGRITCLLGASPGASTSVKIMLDVLEKAFPELTESESGKRQLNNMVPFYKKEVTKEMFKVQLEKSNTILSLNG